MSTLDPIEEVLVRTTEDHAKELRQVSNALGAISSQLRHGAELHRDMTSMLRRHDSLHRNMHTRVLALEKNAKTSRSRKTSATTLAAWADLLRAFWPYLALAAVIAGRMVLGSTELLTRLIESFSQK